MFNWRFEVPFFTTWWRTLVQYQCSLVSHHIIRMIFTPNMSFLLIIQRRKRYLGINLTLIHLEDDLIKLLRTNELKVKWVIANRVQWSACLLYFGLVKHFWEQMCLFFAFLCNRFHQYKHLKVNIFIKCPYFHVSEFCFAAVNLFKRPQGLIGILQACFGALGNNRILQLSHP